MICNDTVLNPDSGTSSPALSLLNQACLSKNTFHRGDTRDLSIRILPGINLPDLLGAPMLPLHLQPNQFQNDIFADLSRAVVGAARVIRQTREAFFNETLLPFVAGLGRDTELSAEVGEIDIELHRFDDEFLSLIHNT